MVEKIIGGLVLAGMILACEAARSEPIRHTTACVWLERPPIILKEGPRTIYLYPTKSVYDPAPPGFTYWPYSKGY